MTNYSGTENLEVMACAANYNKFLAQLTQECAPRDSVTLDFGAGIGTFAEHLRASGYMVECVEPDISQRSILSASDFSVYADVDEVQDGKFDFIYSLNVLEHIAEDQLALNKLLKKLRHGGCLFIYVPAFPVLFSSMDAKVGHFRRYRRGRLISQVRAAGFHVQIARYCDSLGFFASLIFKFFGNADGLVNARALAAYDRYVFPISRFIDIFAGRFFGKNVFVRAYKHS